MKWITEGFEGFSKGTMGNGGQNLYVSKRGILQRIFQYDLNLDGKPDLLFACSQSMNERPPVYVYKDLPDREEYFELPAGAYDGVMVDLNEDGYDDLILACQHDGAHSDAPSVIYYGGPRGLCERNRIELYAPSSIGVCAGDFNGDGRKDLVFLSNRKLRVFYQAEQGIGPAEFRDYEIDAESASAADLDGDGYCDLLFKGKDGRVGILFGGADGLDVNHVLFLQQCSVQEVLETSGSTAGMAATGSGWKVGTPVINGSTCLFVIEDGIPVFYRCDKERNLEKVLQFDCGDVVAAAAADLTGNGVDDIAFAVFKDKEELADCCVYLGDESGYFPDRCVKIPVQGAVNVTTAQLSGAALLFCRAGEYVEQEVDCPVYRLEDNGIPHKIASVKAGDSMRILAGKPKGKEGNDWIVTVNHTLNRKMGGENIYIYLGGEDGYLPERRVDLPGHSAVEGLLCDFFDRGAPDALVVNCFEDAAFDDDGSYIYTNDGTGLSPERKIKIPTVRAHGVAVGDFRKSGYLDLAFGGYMNRELRIFHGSESGYSLDNCTRIVLGEENEEYVPPIAKRKRSGDSWYDPDTEKEVELRRKYGEVRWLLAADLNQDGWLDLIVSEILGPRCFILWGGPEGFSWEQKTELLTDGVAYAAVADLDKDGWPDLILASHMSTKKSSKYEAYVTIYWGSPEGFRENQKQQLPVICANSVTVGDFHQSGNLDIFATAYQNGRDRDIWARLYSNRDGDFSLRRVEYLFNHSGCGCVAGDFNGDGYTDLAVAGHKEYGNHESHSFVFWGGPHGLSDERKTILPATGPHGMSTVDPGNIMDRGPREYYVSEKKEIHSILKSVTWEGSLSSTSWVELAVRAANNEEELETMSWKPVESGADISGLEFTGVIQYRLALCASCGCGTPRIHKVTVEY